LKSRGLDISKWKLVLSDVLHAERSLLCTATNATLHEMFLFFIKNRIDNAISF